MRINFRQGIITHPIAFGGQQQFLTKTGSYITLQTANGRTDITVAHGIENYLLTESSTVNNAWGPLQSNTNYWLYLDINLLTAVRTFGFTTIQPITSSIQPTGVDDLHWFNSSTTKMYVYKTGRWHEVIRVFVAKVNNTIFTGLGYGDNTKPFIGTQVGITVTNQLEGHVLTGRIIVDNTGTPIRKSNGAFFTTEDDFFVNGSPVNAIRLESNIVSATANQNIAKYQVVKYTTFGRVSLAQYEDTQTTMIAMCMEDLFSNDVGNLCIQGVITNPDWNFSHAGLQLWIDGYGLLTEIDPHNVNPLLHPEGRVAVARVLTPTSIFFDQGLGGKGDKGNTFDVLPLASSTLLGVTKLSVIANDPLNPIACGDNDPRLNPYTHPATHPATMVTADTYGFLNGLTVQNQLHQLADRDLNSLGGVIINSPNTNDYLKFNGTNWVNGTIIIPSVLDDLSDVVITTPTSSDYLKFNGTNWVNSSLSITLSGDITGTGVSPISTTLSNNGVTPGTYNSVAVDSTGRVTQGSNDTTLPYDVVFYIPNNPIDINTIVTGFIAPRIITITDSSLNIAKTSIPGTTITTTFNIKKNGVQSGSVVFYANNPIGSIFLTQTIILNIYDILTVCTTDTIDPEIAGIGIAIVGISETHPPLPPQ